jgi:hypothetical protein
MLQIAIKAATLLFLLPGCMNTDTPINLAQESKALAYGAYGGATYGGEDEGCAPGENFCIITCGDGGPCEAYTDPDGLVFYLCGCE